jgi:hypothetical protein
MEDFHKAGGLGPVQLREGDAAIAPLSTAL